jgi:hypothetical protein
MKMFSLSILLIVLLAPPALAEYLQGTVVGIDHGRRQVQLLLTEGPCSFEPEGPAVAAQEPEPPLPRRQITVQAAWLPGCLGQGAQVYARGHYAADNADLFEAEEVFPCRQRGAHDPTGVRSRFHHQRKQMMRHMGRDIHE